MQRWIGIAFTLFLASCACSLGDPPAPPVAPVPPGGICRADGAPCAGDTDCCSRICHRAPRCKQDYCTDKPDPEEGGI